MIKVTINSTPAELPDNSTVADVAAAQGIAGGAAIAVNDRLVCRADWASTPVPADANIVIIKAAYGG